MSRFNMVDTKAKNTVLIVDDDPICREFLEYHLQTINMQTLTAQDGQAAIEIINRVHPDLILLDLNMPRLNGEDFLRTLASKGLLEQLRIIVVSSSSGAEAVAKSIQLGADDHLVKPFEPIILNARIESSLARLELQRLQVIENSRLERLVRKRTRELEEANSKLKELDTAKNEFLTVLSHELRTPLAGISSVEILFEEEDLSHEEKEELMSAYHNSYAKLLDLVEQASLLAQMSTNRLNFETQDNSIIEILNSCLASSECPKSLIDLAAADESTGHSDTIYCDSELLQSALSAIIKCAKKFCKNNSPLSTILACKDGEYSISFIATGYQIPDTHLDKAFSIMAIPDALFPGGELGLGLALGKRILDQIGGKASVYNQRNDQVVFCIKLPLGALVELSSVQ